MTAITRSQTSRDAEARAYLANDAMYCNENGWECGDMLRNDDYGTTIIEITAIGIELVLARAVVKDGKRKKYGEAVWNLTSREWRRVEDNS